MANRKVKFKNGDYYHIYNKSIDHIEVFSDLSDYNRFLYLIDYYRYTGHELSYSQFKRTSIITKETYLKRHYIKKCLQVEILAFCLIPNHYHFLIKQRKSGGVQKFIGEIINAYTKYKNIKTQRKGNIFLQPFREKALHNTNAILHVSRYIHNNPYKHNLVNNFEDCVRFSFSSLKHYIADQKISFISDDKLQEICSKNSHSYLDYCQAPFNVGG